MRRLLRICWTTTAAASLLCGVAAAGAWVRSYFVFDIVKNEGSDPSCSVGTDAGRIGIIRSKAHWPWAEPRPDPRWEYLTYEPGQGSYRPAIVRALGWAFEIPGLRYASGGFGEYTGGMLVVHLAYPTALFSIAPLAWLVGYRKRRRQAARARAGLCASCGYDLRASAGRCPECGASTELKRGDHG